MKRRETAWLLALLLAAPLAAMAEDDSAKARDLAQEFNVSSSQLMDIKQNQNLSWDEIKTSLMISQHSGASLDEVVRLKQSGMSFDDIASRYNLKLEDIEKSHVEKSGTGADVMREAPATPRRVHRRASRLADEYDVSSDEVMRLHDRGLSWKEVRHTLFIAEQSGRPVDEIVGLKESGVDWDDIATRYNVNLKDEGKRKKKEKQRQGTERDIREAPAPKHEGIDKTPSGEGTGATVPPESVPVPDQPAPDQRQVPRTEGY